MVYVTQEQPGKDISSARKFGKIQILLPPGVQVTFSAAQAAAQISPVLSNFRDGDYLLLIGDPVLIGVVTAVAAHWNNGRVSFLKWDRKEGQYLAIDGVQLY